MSEDRRYVFEGGPDVDAPLFHAHVAIRYSRSRSNTKRPPCEAKKQSSVVRWWSHRDWTRCSRGYRDVTACNKDAST